MTIPVGADSLLAELRGDLAAILYTEPQDLGEDADFQELGLDSILGLEFLAVINGRYQLTENIDAVYDHPTLSSLTRYLDDRRRESGKLDRPAPAR